MEKNAILVPHGQAELIAVFGSNVEDFVLGLKFPYFTAL